MAESSQLPLHSFHVNKASLIINRLHTFTHGIALMALIYYRVSFLSQISKSKTRETPVLPHLLVFGAELMLSFMWLLSQPLMWRPVNRTVYPERLPGDAKLPPVDVFICTVDPDKEPSVDVMNTVISAMALDYPPDKLYVYLSDDGGSSVTLNSVKEAWRFAKFWVPFCRAYGIKTRCPKAYFSADINGDRSCNNSETFLADKRNVEQKYEEFKESLLKIKENTSSGVSKDHPPRIEVINDGSSDADQVPLLVYVCREKRPSHPHHFKAGALNVLLRVSGLISNSGYVLVQDCDMYCNDPKSARQAMCFFLDHKISTNLGFVQFPQRFHNISKTDVYDSQLRTTFSTLWPGFDGLNGPPLTGTGFFIKREALYGTSTIITKDVDLGLLRKSFGPSNEFIKSLVRINKPYVSDNEQVLSSSLLEETKYLASSTFEVQTTWGKEVGFRYFSVVEDFFTGFMLQCKGWKSVYYNPSRPAFLGSATTNLNDLLVQGTRWAVGSVQIAVSRFCPLTYGPPRMSLSQSMCYAVISSYPLYFLPLICLSIVPQLSLVRGISLYPEVSSPYFVLFLIIFLSSNVKHMQEVLSTGGCLRSWLHEQRMWMIKAATCYLYGSINACLEKVGLQEASFLPTNKVDDDEQFKRYNMGIYDFQASTMLIAPLCTFFILNVASLVIGVVRMVILGSCNQLFLQGLISFFVVAMNVPIFEGMVLRKDKGRISSVSTCLGALLSVSFLLFSGLFFLY